METKALATRPEQKGLAIASWEDLMGRAEFFAKSQLIPTTLRGKPADVAIILQMGWELGIDPMQAINGIEVIQGKPCVKPEMALALIRARVPGAVIQIKSGPESCTVLMSRSKDDMSDAYETTWDKERARLMGLLNKDNYKNQLATMLKWRAVGDAARTVFPDLTKGLYVAEEMLDQDPPPPGTTGEKSAALAALIRPEKDVVGEVEPPKDAPPHDASKDSRPHAYWCPEIGPCKGKQLRSFDDQRLINIVDKTREFYNGAGKEWIVEYKRFCDRADEYLGRAQPEADVPITTAREAIDVPNTAASSDPTLFERFPGGPGVPA